jgi:hypothetical protein
MFPPRVIQAYRLDGLLYDCFEKKVTGPVLWQYNS